MLRPFKSTGGFIWFLQMQIKKLKMSQNKSPDQPPPPETIKLIIWVPTATGYNGWNKNMKFIYNRGVSLNLFPTVNNPEDNSWCLWTKEPIIGDKLVKWRAELSESGVLGKRSAARPPVWPSELWQGRKVKSEHVY